MSETSYPRYLRANQIAELLRPPDDRRFASAPTVVVPRGTTVADEADLARLTATDVDAVLGARPVGLSCAIQAGEDGPVETGAVWVHVPDKVLDATHGPLRFRLFLAPVGASPPEVGWIDIDIVDEITTHNGLLFALIPAAAFAFAVENVVDIRASVVVVDAGQLEDGDDADDPVLGASVLILVSLRDRD